MLGTITESLHDHPVGYAIWAVGILVTYLAGGKPEKLAAAVLLANIAVNMIWKPDELGGVFWHVLVQDLAVLAAFAILISIFARRWLVWAFAIQVVSVASHFPRLLDASVRPLGYAWLETATGYLLVLAVTLGALLEGRSHAHRRSCER